MNHAVQPVLREGVARRSTERRMGSLSAIVGLTNCALASLAVARLAVPNAAHWVSAGLVVAWSVAGSLLTFRRVEERIGMLSVIAAAIGALALAANAFGPELLERLCIGLLPATGMHLLAGLPTGTLRGRGTAIAVGAGYAIGCIAGAFDVRRHMWPLVALWIVAIVAGLHVAHRRYLTAAPVDRRRMQWVGWALVVSTEFLLAVLALRLMTDWPPNPRVIVLAFSAVIPASLVAGTYDKTIGRVDRLLTQTVALAGLTALVVAAYVAVVVMVGRDLDDGERALLLYSMGIAVFAAVMYQPLRARLTNVANQVVYGERVAPDEMLRTWGSRLTRAIPLDELLLQLTESLRKSMSLAAAQIFTGGDGRYELAAGVPHRPAPALVLGEQERAVVARAGVTGGSWLDVWIPHLAGANSANTRIAPIVHAGELLGLIVMTRRAEGEQFRPEDDLVVTELARQVGLALHNVQLDSALQESLEQLQSTNVELQESRLRIVSAGDQERRKLERNLHDGAQQHLVAMAVKLRLVEDLIEDAPHDALKVVEEIRSNLKETIVELRALAHGIFPPLLSSGGLQEALPTAASRASLITTVETVGLRRYTPEIESTVYFCCLEALQNACKHAGESAEITVHVDERDGRLHFAVTDTGVGFDTAALTSAGHGFVNMKDRLGAVGGRLDVESRPGKGTSIRGDVPLP